MRRTAPARTVTARRAPPVFYSAAERHRRHFPPSRATTQPTRADGEDGLPRANRAPHREPPATFSSVQETPRAVASRRLLLVPAAAARRPVSDVTRSLDPRA